MTAADLLREIIESPLTTGSMEKKARAVLAQVDKLEQRNKDLMAALNGVSEFYLASLRKCGLIDHAALLDALIREHDAVMALAISHWSEAGKLRLCDAAGVVRDLLEERK